VSKVGVVQEREQCPGQGGRIIRRDEETCFAVDHHFGNPPNAACDHRLREAGRLHQDPTEAL
jgi:hypothetical protein